MENSNHSKTYNSFAEHPFALAYFNYIDILISKGWTNFAQHLSDIANAPLTDKNIDLITDILALLSSIANENNENEFETETILAN